MRVLFIFALLAVVPAAAADQQSIEARCDYLIGTALKMPYREGGWKLLNSRTVQECLKRFPDLNYKYFPLRSDKDGMLCDRGPGAVAGTGKCPVASRDPSYSVKIR
ncbi:hypothetical protein A2118_02855 [Candidatus Kaiserbacteria bacterium GWA2_50_9]|uniref:Uncharacterized protein n=1 Tax=Candidatus Kaiserbacteria bacterium GWA2_50_9 TaxID=1798474 RepID=A0A1F6BU31_9BACT|nr:MAG: hypothetical protein A2118_02855 [Candidatus Kaiserbacteria bacterium GWA2_50_9]